MRASRPLVTCMAEPVSIGRGKRRAAESDMAADTDAPAAATVMDTADGPVEHTPTRPRAGDGDVGTGGAAAASHRSYADMPHNFPLAGGHRNVAMLVKVYDAHLDQLRVGDALDVLGVLSLDDLGADDDDPFMFGAQRAPASVLPRLHALLIERLPTPHPLLPRAALLPSWLAAVRADSALWRPEAVRYLSAVLGGDDLAAEYLLLHLVSRTTDRPYATVPLGKFALNLSRCSAGHVPAVQAAVHALLPLAHTIPLSIARLSQARLLPRKDYDSDRIEAGELQLAPGTHLLLDELALLPGTLQEPAIRNLRALASLLQTQSIEIDFTHFTREFPVDVAVLVLSEGRTLLPVDAEVPLQGVQPPPDPSSLPSPPPALRSYLAAARLCDVQVPAELATALEGVYVQRRQVDPSIGGVDLARWLCLARLVAASHGHAALTMAHWEHVMALEAARQARRPAPPQAASSFRL